MTPQQTIRYVFQYSENGGSWIDYTNLSSDVASGNQVSQSNITLIMNTQFRVKYTTDLSVGSVPNSIDTYTISIIVNQLPSITPITFASNIVCQNSDITYSNATASGVWTTSNALVATVGATGIVNGVSQGAALIKYIVTDPNTGCKNQDAKSVTVNPTPSIANITDAVCSGVSYTNNPSSTSGNFVPSVTTYTWGMPIASATGLTNLAAASNQSNINALLTNTTNTAISATYTITASRGSCTSTPFNLLLTVTPKPYINNRTVPVCSGSQFTDAPTNSGTDIVPTNIVYSWSAPTATGLSGFSSGVNQSNFSGTLTNSTNGMISVNYTVSTNNSGCTGSTYTATVNVKPTPSIAAKSATICSNTSFNIVIPTGLDIVPVGTTYSWGTPNTPGINGLQSGAGLSSVAGTVSNTTNAPINVDYNIIPISAGCVGSAFVATVTVNPVPIIVNMGPSQSGSGSTFNFPIGTAGDKVPAGTTYAWTSPSVQTGITGAAASGTPSPTSLIGTLTNPTGGYLDATYTITPTFSFCVGNTFTYLVRVYPKPIIGNKQFSICSGVPFIVYPQDGVPIGEVVPSGTTYSWLAPVVTGITGTYSGTLQPNVSGTLINTTNGALVVTYTVTPIANPQAGDPFDIVITVNPLPTATIAVLENSGLQINDGTICSDAIATLSATPVAGVASDYNYTWNQLPVGFANPGNLASFATTILTNAGSYGVSLENKITHCTTASTISTTIVVNTIPNIGTISGTVNTVCVNSTIQLNGIGSSGGATPYTSYQWYTSTNIGLATTGGSTVNIRGVSTGSGSIAFSVLDQVACMSNRSAPYNITVYALPLPPIVTPVNVVYDGLAHQVIATPAAAPLGTDMVEWYALAWGGVSITPTPSISNVGSLTRYAQAINATTGCSNLARVPGTVNITKATLTVTAKTYTKIYNAIPYTSGGVGDVLFNGFVNGEGTSVLAGVLTFTGTSQGAKNIGTYTIMPSGYASSNYFLQYGSGNLTISTKSVSITNLLAQSKVYDATAIANLRNGILVGIENADLASIQLNAIGSFPSKNVGNNLTVISTSTLISPSTGGITALNYTLVQPTGLTASITEKPIDIIGLVTADKIYDATNFASVTGGAFLTAIAAGTGTATDKKTYINDNLQIVPSGYFDNINVANNIGITSTTSLTGLDRLNYSINPIVLTARNITAKYLTMTGLTVPVSKTYDATTIAYVTDNKTLQAFENPGQGNVLDGKAYLSDVVSLVGTPVGTYNTKDVLTANSVSFSRLSLAGANANNYSLTIQAAYSSTITPKSLTIFILGVPISKVYDGNTSSIVNVTTTLNTAENILMGTVLDGNPYIGDDVIISGTPIGNYNSKNVVNASSVKYSNLNLSGNQATNYSLGYQSEYASVITPLNINLNANSQTKVYGEVDPIFTSIHDPVVVGDNFTGSLLRDLGENVGSYAIKLGNLSLGTNYTITFTSNNLKITSAAIVIKPNPVKRTYGDLPLSLVFSSSGILVNGLKNNELIASVTLTLSSNVGAGNSMKDGAGRYTNTVLTSNPIGGTALLSNYEIVLLPGDLIVEKFKINIISDPKSKRKLQVDPVFTYTISKQLNVGDSLTGNLTRAVGEELGFYKILQGTVSINDNYDINYISTDLEILTIERVIVVPNAFTPNGDGLNDVIKVVHNSTIFSLNYFKIYNRAGKLIFETKNIEEGWDGKLNGIVAESDAYYWLAEYNTWDNLLYQDKGSFILIN